MPTPPTLVQTLEQGFATAGNPQPLWLIFNLSYEAGDLIVVSTTTPDSAHPISGVAAAGGVLTFAEAVRFVPFGKTTAQVFAATATAPGTAVEITVTKGDSGQFSGALVTVWRDHGGLGAVQLIAAQAASGAPTWSFDTERDNSAIVASVGDIGANAGAVGNWSEPPAVGDDFYYRDVGIAAYYHAVYPNSGTAGTKTIGVTTPSMNWLGAAVEVLAAIAPTNTSAPAITGTPKVGQLLTCSTGVWNGAPVPTFAYQWQHDTGAGWANLSGATASTFTPSTSHIGDAIRCIVTATNSNGSASVTTGAVGPVDPADLLFSVRLSGGSSNSDPALSIGGAESSEEATGELFDDVTFDQAVSGMVDYRLVYLHNDDVEDATAAVFVSGQLETGRQIAVGAPTEAEGVLVTPIADDQEPPPSVAFSAPSVGGAGVALGVIPAGSFRGVWIRRTTMPGTNADITNPWSVTFEVSR